MPDTDFGTTLLALARAEAGETFKPGEVLRVECYDWTGGQIGNNDSANDIRDVDLTRVHYLSGPFGFEGAEPGDLLVVDILDIGALPDSKWGFNGLFAKENGGGFLTEHYPKATKSIWDFEGIYTTSRHIPGVRYPGLIHPGLIGCLPDAKLLAEANRREAALITFLVTLSGVVVAGVGSAFWGVLAGSAALFVQQYGRDR